MRTKYIRVHADALAKAAVHPSDIEMQLAYAENLLATEEGRKLYTKACASDQPPLNAVLDYLYN
ncbi:hypothetical protein KY311_03105 [Candidatus Woesearchaeota archaeon]|nr:hypothetical protein [Candidatus Woesearchaeota archaeon]MBW3016815.1 hypothetical protein [Candidatus Woesearchaeota archaeon]